MLKIKLQIAEKILEGVHSINPDAPLTAVIIGSDSFITEPMPCICSPICSLKGLMICVRHPITANVAAAVMGLYGMPSENASITEEITMINIKAYTSDTESESEAFTADEIKDRK